jgi:hypothetical protein
MDLNGPLQAFKNQFKYELRWNCLWVLILCYEAIRGSAGEAGELVVSVTLPPEKNPPHPPDMTLCRLQK